MLLAMNIVMLLFVCFKTGVAARNEFITTADCVCTGQISTYECSVVGGQFTVFKGNVLSVGCEIALIHEEYELPTGAHGECNNGDVVGQGIGVNDNCYTSQLNITVSESLEGKTIECNIDDGTTRPIGMSTINITRVPFPPPTNIELTAAVPKELTFSWMPPPQKCPSLGFNILANNCGTCQNNTELNRTVCRDFAIPNQCTLTVQSVICGNLSSIYTSIPATANLNVPEAPVILESMPHYSDSDKRILMINSTFNTVESFIISGRINGSALSYMIFYNDSLSGTICGSVVIEVQSCRNGVCNHLFDTSSSNCPSSTDINVSVVATNVLGNGPTSVQIFQSGVNNFVNINFNAQMRTIVCEFLNRPLNYTKECSVNITYGDNCDRFLDVYSNEGTDDSIATSQLMLVSGVVEYCFSATATSGNVTVIVEGTFNLFEINIGAVATVSVVVPVIVLFMVPATIIIAIVVWRNVRKSLVTIKFSNPDECGSLSEMLKVFKDNNVNIVRINSGLRASDVKRNFCGSHQMKENYVYISCTLANKENLRGQLNLEIIEDDVVNKNEANSDEVGTYTVKISVHDKPGALWEVMNMLARNKINILGLNTQSNYGKDPNYKDNYVSCWCTRTQRTKLRRGLADAGATHFGEEHDITESSTRTLQFFVKDEEGALTEALKAFSYLNINLTGTNPAYIKLPCRDVPGQEIVYVECRCNDDDRQSLITKLKECGAQLAELHIEKKESSCVFKVSIKDQVGSLVSTLDVFKQMNINIIGVNTFAVDPKINLRPSIKLEYKHIEIEFTSEFDLDVNKFKDRLKASGRITEVEYTPPAQGQTNHMIKFLARHEVGTLAKTLEVFIEHHLNIVSLHQKSLSRDMVYVHNHVRFIATNQQEAEVISKLHATGLVVDVATFRWDDVHIAKMGETQISLGGRFNPKTAIKCEATTEV